MSDESFIIYLLFAGLSSWWAYTLSGIAIVITIIFSVLQIRQLKTRNKELENTVQKRTEEINLKNVELAESLKSLQETQQQLITQEKMVSLGQLTLGIAHEIKNPLNFVSNFAEGSSELLEEFEVDWEEYEKSKDPKEYVFLKDTLTQIKKNNQFVIQNGQRANQIVNSMMNHANDNFGEKSKISVNSLIEEQTNLAYHGFKAQNDKINIKIEKELGADIPSLLMHPQDLGRVLINLINNGCYALAKKVENTQEVFTPIIFIKSYLVNDSIKIHIRDNGTGIPQNIYPKIFQPFFTTKPTGMGTGLGLSISYDIISNRLHGNIEVESMDNEFTEFIITIPVSKNQKG